MSGRGSTKLAESLSAGAKEEFEEVLETHARVVEQAVRLASPHGSGSDRRKAAESAAEKAANLHKALVDQIRLQTERAAS